MNTIQENASNELDRRTREYMKSHDVDYREALFAVNRADPALSRRYSHGDIPVSKSYQDELTAAQKAMLELQNDSAKVQRLASALIDTWAKDRLRNRGEGSPADPVSAYRQAVVDIKRKFPNLARAAQDGFIEDSDFALLSMLVPSVAGEIKRGNYQQDARLCPHCHEIKAYCRAKKLAFQRGVIEDNVAAFSQCIRDAGHQYTLDALPYA